jgi:hypothetical protein
VKSYLQFLEIGRLAYICTVMELEFESAKQIIAATEKSANKFVKKRVSGYDGLNRRRCSLALCYQCTNIEDDLLYTNVILHLLQCKPLSPFRRYHIKRALFLDLCCRDALMIIVRSCCVRKSISSILYSQLRRAILLVKRLATCSGSTNARRAVVAL